MGWPWDLWRYLGDQVASSRQAASLHPGRQLRLLALPCRLASSPAWRPCQARPVLTPRAGCSAGCCELLSRAAHAAGTHPGDIFGAAARLVLSYSKEGRSLPVTAQRGSAGQDTAGKAEVHRSVSGRGLALLALRLANVHASCCRLPSSCSAAGAGALLGSAGAGGALPNTSLLLRGAARCWPLCHRAQRHQNTQRASRCTLRVRSSPPGGVCPPSHFSCTCINL